MCVFLRPDVRKRSSQCGHLKGFAPVCKRMCTFRLPFVEKVLLQTWQLKSFCPAGRPRRTVTCPPVDAEPTAQVPERPSVCGLPRTGQGAAGQWKRELSTFHWEVGLSATRSVYNLYTGASHWSLSGAERRAV